MAAAGAGGLGVAVTRYPAAIRAALAPLPAFRECGKGMPCRYPACTCTAAPMPSMLRQQRVCRIQLAALTRDIARRLRTESQPAQEST
jgi:hypothetical protein